MKKIVFLLAFIPSVVMAAWNDGYVRQAGQKVESFKVTLTTSTAVDIMSSLDVTGNVWLVNVDIFNNSAFTVWLGTNTTSLRDTGFPLLSSTTYTLDGQYTGTLYGTMDITAGASKDVRVIGYFRNRND